MPGFVSRVARSAGNPILFKPFARPTGIKPDSSGLIPGMMVGESRMVAGNRVVSGKRQTALPLSSAAVILSTIARMASVGSSLGRVCMGISG